MSREVRRVSKDWQHPRAEGTYRDGSPRYVGLMKGPWSQAVANWDEGKQRWDDGERLDYSKPGRAWKSRDGDDRYYSYEDWDGGRPVQVEYMPEWTEDQATHLMMYETVSEGTPISPAFETPEELARWLADNNASASGFGGASYENWLAMIREGWAPSLVIDGGKIQSGVDFVANIPKEA